MPGWLSTLRTSPLATRHPSPSKTLLSGPPLLTSEIPHGGKAKNPISSFLAFGPAPSTTPSAAPPFRPRRGLSSGLIATVCARPRVASAPMHKGATIISGIAPSAGLLSYPFWSLSFIPWPPSWPPLGSRPVRQRPSGFYPRSPWKPPKPRSFGRSWPPK